MPEQIVPLFKGDSEGAIGFAADYFDLLPVNMYVVPESHLGAPGYILTYPGLEPFGQGSGFDRMGVYNERFDTHFRVSGDQMIEIDTAGNKTDLGLITGIKQAANAESFNTQAIVTDGKYYLYDPTNGFRQIIDEDLGTPIDITWVDGYYFFTDGESIYHTDITDEESIDPLKFATAEYSPDPVLGVAKDKDNQILVFGRYSTEYFFNRATEDFAFQRLPTKAQKIGIVGTFCKCELDGDFFILGGRKGESPHFLVLGVGTSTRINSRFVDRIIEQYTEEELADVRLESRVQKSGQYMLAHLPNETLLFNLGLYRAGAGVNGAWSILKTDITGDATYRGINGIYDRRISKWVYGDKQTPEIGILNEEIATHYGAIVESIFYSPLMSMETLSIDKIELNSVPGFTAETATVSLSMTSNGLTYTDEYFKLYGEPMNYSSRYIIRRLGYVRDHIGFKFRNATAEKTAFSNFKIVYG